MISLSTCWICWRRSLHGAPVHHTPTRPVESRERSSWPLGISRPRVVSQSEVGTGTSPSSEPVPFSSAHSLSRERGRPLVGLGVRPVFANLPITNSPRLVFWDGSGIQKLLDTTGQRACLKPSIDVRAEKAADGRTKRGSFVSELSPLLPRRADFDW